MYCLNTTFTNTVFDNQQLLLLLESKVIELRESFTETLKRHSRDFLAKSFKPSPKVIAGMREMSERYLFEVVNSYNFWSMNYFVFEPYYSLIKFGEEQGISKIYEGYVDRASSDEAYMWNSLMGNQFKDCNF